MTIKKQDLVFVTIEAQNSGPDSPKKPHIFHRRRIWRRRLAGWRGGTMMSIIICITTLLVNVLLIIIAGTAWNHERGIATAYTGDCKVAARQTTAAHLFINLLSSLLLGASNYCMQRLVAPTREEIDKAHAKYVALHIGIPSIKNVFYISRLRAALWVVLALSSLPLHFLYNSALFGTMASNMATFSHTTAPDRIPKFSDSTRFANLSNEECSRRYSAQFFTDVGSGWGLLDASSVPPDLSNNSHFWSIRGFGGFKLDSKYLYCISEKVQPRCQVQISLMILGVVIASNIIKLVVMCYMMQRLDHRTIVTVGDAIESFLRIHDISTKNKCLLSIRNLKTHWNPTSDDSLYLRWQQRFRASWSMACSRRRWLFASFCGLVAVVPLAALITLSKLYQLSHDIYGWNGFGRVSSKHLIKVDVATPFDPIILFVLVVNAPQFVVSLLYFIFNGLFTCMLAAREWTQYAVKRAPLRVTLPLPGQRSTHFLQLPYSWSFPLLVFSILLHWFVSQSLFLVRVAFYENGKLVTPPSEWQGHSQSRTRSVPTGAAEIVFPGSEYSSAPSENVFTGIGYSDTALVTTLACVLGLSVVCRLVAVSSMYAKGLPIGGTNSAVISSTCHVQFAHDKGGSYGAEMVDKPLKWGVTIEGGLDKVGHLCFSDGEVEAPEYDCLYAGTGETHRPDGP